MNDIFAAPKQEADGTWTEQRLGRLLSEAREIMLANPHSFTGLTAYLTLIDCIGHEFEPFAVQQPGEMGTKLARVFKRGGMGAEKAATLSLLYSSLKMEYQFPPEMVVDANDKDPAVSFSVPNELGEGVVTKINISEVVRECESVVSVMPQWLFTGEVKPTQAFKQTFRAK